MEHPSLTVMNPAMMAAKLERSKRNPNEILNLCPYGCSVQRLDDKGYCRHLIGWTIDGQTVELREKCNNGRERVGELIGIVEDEDQLISGTPFRTDKNGNPTPTPSHRVYRRTGKAPILDDGKQLHREQGKEMSFADEPEDALAAV